MATEKSVSCSTFNQMASQSCNSLMVAAKWSASFRGRKSNSAFVVSRSLALPQEANANDRSLAQWPQLLKPGGHTHLPLSPGLIRPLPRHSPFPAELIAYGWGLGIFPGQTLSPLPFDTDFLLPLPLCLRNESPRHWKRRTRARLGVEAAPVSAHLENLLRTREWRDQRRCRVRSRRP